MGAVPHESTKLVKNQARAHMRGQIQPEGLPGRRGR